MDSIFDIASQAELSDLLGTEKYPGDVMLYDTERRLVQEDADYGYSLLASLAAMRDDMPLAEKHLSSIQDDQRRLDATLSITELEVA